MIAYIDPKPVA